MTREDPGKIPSPNPKPGASLLAGTVLVSFCRIGSFLCKAKRKPSKNISSLHPSLDPVPFQTEASSVSPVPALCTPPHLQLHKRHLQSTEESGEGTGMGSDPSLSSCNCSLITSLSLCRGKEPAGRGAGISEFPRPQAGDGVTVGKAEPGIKCLQVVLVEMG